MPPFMAMGSTFLIELAYALAIIASSLVIFFKTREIEELSGHKGIKYFRMAFLFFAISYFLRFFSRILLLGLFVTGTRVPRASFTSLTSTLFLYSGFMTMFYLLYGISIKRLGKSLPKTTDVFHILSILLSSVIVLLGIPGLFIMISLALLVYMLFIIYSDYADYRKKGKVPTLYIIYFLLILFSLLNVVDILIPNVFRAMQTLVYLLSMSIFLFILYRVVRILDAEPNKRKVQRKGKKEPA
jgi:hypothetical protein